ncbi:MAG: radical SAM protein [Candidatus Thorarchaeota archaeon]
MDSEEILYLKVRLLLEGATLPEGYSHGRKGGAGPVGGRYFYLPNGRPCGIPIRTEPTSTKFHSSTLEHIEGDRWVYDSKYNLLEVPKPDLYDHSTSDGVEYGKVALLHGDECLATTVVQSCKYWASGEQCKFCTIPSSYLSGMTIREKTPSQIAEVVEGAEKTGAAKHVLLTTGTSEGDDMGIERMIEIAREIRMKSEIPIAVQFEPPLDHSYLQRLAEAGVNAVGIHIESADDRIRAEVCPGKHQHGPIDLYVKTWDAARKYFEPGDVTTFILYGLGEDRDITLRFCEDMAQRGILPIVTPIRPAPGSQLADFTPSYVGNLDEAIEFYKELGRTLFKYQLNPMKTSGGCSRCGACTPIQEAYDWASVH